MTIMARTTRVARVAHVACVVWRVRHVRHVLARSACSRRGACGFAAKGRCRACETGGASCPCEALYMGLAWRMRRVRGSFRPGGKDGACGERDACKACDACSACGMCGTRGACGECDACVARCVAWCVRRVWRV